MNSYSIIPTIILEDTELSANSKVLFCFLNSFSNKWGYTIADNNTLSEKLGCSVRTLQRMLKELSDRKYIEIIQTPEKRKIVPILTIREPKVKKRQFTSENKTEIVFEEL